jgi:hypothetical protein
MSAKPRTILAGAVIVFALPAASLAAQQPRPPESSTSALDAGAPGAPRTSQGPSTRGRKWEIEGHGGWVGASDVTSGTPIDAFPRGATIPSLSTFTSRAVSSWFYGDGPVLLAEVFALTGRTQRITPLDSALKQGVATREGGGSFGFRLSRQLTSRFSAEFNFDRASARSSSRPASRTRWRRRDRAFRRCSSRSFRAPT